MASATTEQQRTASARRLVGIDLARCLALLGMIAVHVLDADNPRVWLDGFRELSVGRASALFAVLAGVSLALTTGRRTPVQGAAWARAAASIAVRGLLVALIGLWLGGFDSEIAVILTYYGVLFLLGLPFLALRAGPLLVLAGLWAVAGPVISHVVRPSLPERQFLSPTFELVQADPTGQLAELFFTGYYPAFVWLAYLLLGLGLGRLDLGARQVQLALVGGGGVLAGGAALLSPVLVARAGFTAADGAVGAKVFNGTTPTDGWRWLLLDAPHSGTPFDLAATGGAAALALGLCLLVAGLLGDLPGRAGPFATRAVAVLGGAGAATLTLYTLHVLMRSSALPPDGEVIGLDAEFRVHALVVLAIGAVLAALGRRGPLEWAVGLIPRLIRR